ncbi:prephenate dehydrogenase [Chloroflexota bacterium]
MRISIIGLGLIGGSLGLALKKANWMSAEITGYVRRPETGKLALNIGAVDRIASTLEESVNKSDLVIISTPVLTIKDIFHHIAPYLPKNCIVTDTASTKQQVMNWAQEILPAGISFIGGHPMAGTHSSGLEYAQSGLFLNSTYCLVCGTQTTPAAEKTLTDMIQEIGSTPMKISAQEHDNMAAGISHLPFLLSAALVLTTSGNPDWDKMSQLASSGYRDTTRLASGSIDVNAQICLTNQEAILYWMDLFGKELKKLENLIADRDEDIINTLNSANKARRKWQAKYHQ